MVSLVPPGVDVLDVDDDMGEDAIIVDESEPDADMTQSAGAGSSTAGAAASASGAASDGTEIAGAAAASALECCEQLRAGENATARDAVTIIVDDEGPGDGLVVGDRLNAGNVDNYLDDKLSLLLCSALAVVEAERCACIPVVRHCCAFDQVQAIAPAAHDRICARAECGVFFRGRCPRATTPACEIEAWYPSSTS